MRARQCVSLTVACLLAAAAAATDLDGTAPLTCSAEQGHDCLPGSERCGRLEPESHQPPLIAIDFARQEVRSPYRTAVLRAARTTTSSESLILQGTDLLFAWSALINKKTGALTVSIADRQGAYVVFGRCKPAKTG